jgi:hypothetical protein
MPTSSPSTKVTKRVEKERRMRKEGECDRDWK